MFEYLWALWPVLLLGCVLALPIASMMDKRKARAAMGGYDEPTFDDEPEYQGEEVAEVQEEFPQEEMPALEQPAADDFSAFDNEFK